MKKINTTNVLFCGIGGQGVLTAAEILGVAAMLEGFHVRKSEVHGMAQRGGSVESHLRFGRNVFSPLIPRAGADFLVSFHIDEHARLRDYLKKDGLDLVNELDTAGLVLKDMRYLNIFLLGRLSRHTNVSEENWLEAIDLSVSPFYAEKNKQIFKEASSL